MVACGFAAGTILTLVTRFLPRRDLQLAAGAAAVFTVVLAWTAALGPST